MREPVREALADIQRGILGFFADNVRLAQADGGLPASLDPRELAFEIDAILVGADVNYVLFKDPMRLEAAKDSMRRLLGLDSRPRRGW
jgi:hypothetical protein